MVTEGIIHDLPMTYQQADIAYCIVQANIGIQGEALARFVAENPGWFPPLDRTSAGGFEVFAVKLPADAGRQQPAETVPN
jgi:hypothetical protein